MIKYTILILILHFFSLPTIAQQSIITGTVKAPDGTPVENATVSLKSQVSQATVTDSSGNFSFPLNTFPATLQISHIQYQAAEFRVTGNEGNLAIILLPGEGNLNEVIVQAYGTTTRRLNTGNIARVSSREIGNQPVTNPLAALQGRVPGLDINRTSGLSGASFSAEIRGRTSLDLALSQNDPLVVIDGVIFEAGNQPANQLRTALNNRIGGAGGLSPLNSINPADIESIEVLKDADATAIYGSRGANGVIIITTKKPRAGKTEVNLTYYSGWSSPARAMQMLNTQEYVAMRREAFTNDSLQMTATPGASGFAPDILVWDTTRYNDLNKILIGQTAKHDNAQLSLSGGNALTRFLIAGGYNRETNVFARDLSDTRLSAHFNLTHSSSNRKFTSQFSGGYSGNTNRLIATDLSFYLNMPPNLLLRNSDGTLAWEEGGVNIATISNIDNPLLVYEQKRSNITHNLFSNALLSYKLLDGLEVKTSIGYNEFRLEEKALNPSTAINPYVAAYIKPSSSFANNAMSSWIAEPHIIYLKKLKDSKINFLIGASFQEKKYRFNSVEATEYTGDLLLNNPEAAGKVTASINDGRYRYNAFFGRANYDYREKYLLNLSFRRDGSSRFAPANRFSNFWAVGAAWIFTEEKWFARNEILSFGKLRASYGVTGNDQIGDYNYLELWRSGLTYQGIPTLSPDRLYNPDFHWERNNKFETAIEFGFLKNRLTGSVSYFDNRSSNQLVNYVLPRHTGSNTVVRNLPALIRNNGTEVVLNSVNINGKTLQWRSAFNITIPKNKLLSFPGLANSTYSSLYLEGYSLSIVNRLKYLGVDPATGVYKFEDVNGDNIYNKEDYQVSMDLAPKYYGGLSNTLNLYNFSLDFLFEFRKQFGRNYLAQLYNMIPGSLINQPQIVMERWRKPGDVATIQRFITGRVANEAFIASNVRLPISDGIYSDASFIRLRNIALGYNLPASVINKARIESLRFFVNAQNLLTITNYKGSDPETRNLFSLPPLKTIACGVQLTF